MWLVVIYNKKKQKNDLFTQEFMYIMTTNLRNWKIFSLLKPKDKWENTKTRIDFLQLLLGLAFKKWCLSPLGWSVFEGNKLVTRDMFQERNKKQARSQMWLQYSPENTMYSSNQKL